MTQIQLTEEHYKEILAIRDGADIMGMWNAKILREVEKVEPGFINIVDPQGEYDPAGKIPYFGAIATHAGIMFATRRLEKIKKEGGAS